MVGSEIVIIQSASFNALLFILHFSQDHFSQKDCIYITVVTFVSMAGGMTVLSIQKHPWKISLPSHVQQGREKEELE